MVLFVVRKKSSKELRFSVGDLDDDDVTQEELDAMGEGGDSEHDEVKDPEDEDEM